MSSNVANVFADRYGSLNLDSVHPMSLGSLVRKAASHEDYENSDAFPIFFDLDGNGVTINELPRSTVYEDADSDGLLNRSAWAGAGDGMLFFDPDGRNAITEMRQYVFTEWDPTAKTDMEALRGYFDTNGDGKLTAADADFAKFKVLLTNPDGSTTVKSLAELGITAINLTTDATRIELPDGSVIEGRRPIRSPTAPPAPCRAPS